MVYESQRKGIDELTQSPILDDPAKNNEIVKQLFTKGWNSEEGITITTVGEYTESTQFLEKQSEHSAKYNDLKQITDKRSPGVKHYPIYNLSK